MKIKRFKIKNFMSYEHAEIEFSDGINVIVGKNGSGKSCIIDGIYIILLTLKNSGFKKEDIKNKWLNKEPYLELYFEHNGKNYGLKYENNQYFIKDEAIFKPFVQEKYKEFINENIFPDDIIKNAMIIRQDDIKLLSLDRKTRIDVIKKFVGIDDVFDALIILEKAYKDWEKELNTKKENIEDLKKTVDKDLEKKLNETLKKYKEIKIKIEELSNLEETERKKLKNVEEKIKKINEILNEIKIKSEKREIIKNEIEKLNKKIEALEKSYIEEDEYLKIKKELEKKEKKEKIKEKILSIEKEIDQIKNEIEKIEFDKNVFEKFEKIEKEYQKQNELLSLIKRLKNEIVPEYKEKLEKFRKLEKLEIDKNLSLIRFQIEKLKKDLIELNEREEKIRGNEECPVCKNKLTLEIKNKLLNEINLEKNKIKNEISNLEKKIIEYEKLLKEFKILKKIENELIKSEENERKIEEIKKEINSEILNEYAKLKAKYFEEIKKQEKYNVLNKKLQEKIKELEIYKKEFNSLVIDEKLINLDIFDLERKYNNYKLLREYKKELENRLRDFENIKKYIEELKKKLEMFENLEILEKQKNKIERNLEEILVNKNSLIKKFGEVESSIKFLKEKYEIQKETEKKIKKLKIDIEELEKLCKKCSKYIKELDEYYSYLKNEAIPEIVEIASEIFVRLTDYEFERLEYIEDKDKFDIVAIKKGESFDPKSLSGGQQTLYSLAIRFAIGIWSKKNSGLEKIDCIILDEPTIHLDDSAIERLKNEIENLGIEQMIIVTHDQIFPKIADKIFKVSIEKGFSKIKEEKEMS